MICKIYNNMSEEIYNEITKPFNIWESDNPKIIYDTFRHCILKHELTLWNYESEVVKPIMWFISDDLLIAPKYKIYLTTSYKQHTETPEQEIYKEIVYSDIIKLCNMIINYLNKES